MHGSDVGVDVRTGVRPQPPQPCREAVLSVGRAAIALMRTGSPHLPDVVRSLPVLLVRALDSAAAGREVDALVEAGWRTGQLRVRIGAEPSQGSPDRDAASVLALLRALRLEVPPDVAHARELERRRRDREDELARAPRPASPEVRRRSVERIRGELGLLPRRTAVPAPRRRPDCSLCGREAGFFVSPEVHLCSGCVALLATGEARLAPVRATG